MTTKATISLTFAAALCGAITCGFPRTALAQMVELPAKQTPSGNPVTSIKDAPASIERARQVLKDWCGVEVPVTVQPTATEKTGDWSPVVQPGEIVWSVAFPASKIQLRSGTASKTLDSRKVTVVLGKQSGAFHYVRIDRDPPTERVPAIPGRECVIAQMEAEGGEVWTAPRLQIPQCSLAKCLQAVDAGGLSSVDSTVSLIAHYVGWQFPCTRQDCDAWSIDFRGIPSRKDADGTLAEMKGLGHLRHVVRASDAQPLTAGNDPTEDGCEELLKKDRGLKPQKPGAPSPSAPFAPTKPEGDKVPPIPEIKK